MGIDEHIGVIEDLKSTMSVCMSEPEKTEICASLGEAVSTMRKYQQIEQIINYRYTKSVSETLDEIVKVVEDGNDHL